MVDVQRATMELWMHAGGAKQERSVSPRATLGS